MAVFEDAIQNLLRVENGFAADDNGRGAVNFGLTGNFLKAIGHPYSIEDVRVLTRDDAIQIYRKYFWEISKLGQISNQRVATLLFHMVVNNPAKIAIMSFQLALQDSGVVVPATGFVGPRTIVGVNGLDAAKTLSFIEKYKMRMLVRYERLAASDPRYAGDLPGWKNRLENL